MMPSKLLEENGRAHFMTKRFDREGETKHHVQTFCAMKHYDYNHVGQYSYEQLFQSMRELRLPYPQAEQVFTRMVFNVIARNCDDHTKNFAFRLKQNADWEISPAYDICHAYRPASPWVSKHSLSINGKREHILLEDFLVVAKSMNIKKPQQIIQEINGQVQQWERFAAMAGVEDVYVKSIQDTLLDYKV
jgi:serine/threonine-protein kinase HipA